MTGPRAQGIRRLVGNTPLLRLADLTLDPKRKSYVHLVRGELEANGTKLTTGDAALIQGESKLTLDGGKNAEVLVFDLAA